jgi:hypothetical protein
MPSLPSLPGGATAKTSTAAGGLAVAIIWALGLFGVVIPADVAVTLAVGLIGLAGWVAHRFGPQPQPEPPKAGEGE